jgi:hypothetical protein
VLVYPRNIWSPAQDLELCVRSAAFGRRYGVAFAAAGSSYKDAELCPSWGGALCRRAGDVLPSAITHPVHLNARRERTTLLGLLTPVSTNTRNTSTRTSLLWAGRKLKRFAGTSSNTA